MDMTRLHHSPPPPPPHPCLTSLQGAAGWSLPLQLQVSAADPEARAAVEGAGGRVTTVYYSQLGLRALLKVRGERRGGMG